MCGNRPPKTGDSAASALQQLTGSSEGNMWPIFRVTLACAGQEGLGFEVLGFRLSLILGECEFKQGAFGRHHFRFCGGSHSLPGVCTYLCVFFRFEVQVPRNCCQTFLRETRWKPAVCQISAGKPIWKPAVCPHIWPNPGLAGAAVPAPGGCAPGRGRHLIGRSNGTGRRRDGVGKALRVPWGLVSRETKENTRHLPSPGACKTFDT